MIKLERFTKSDFQRLISWVDDEECLIGFAGASFQFPLTEEQLQNYISDERKIIFRVKEIKSGRIIGHAEINRVEEKLVRLCRVLIGEKECRGRGFGQEIIKKLVKFSFESLLIEMVELNVYEQNIAARKCYEKVGFRRNPERDKRTKIHGKKWNSLNMVISREQWKLN